MRKMMPGMDRLIPESLIEKISFGATSPNAGELRFVMRLDYWDATSDRPVKCRFEHEWIVSPDELANAEREGHVDQTLIQIRERERRAFLETLRHYLWQRRMRLGIEDLEVVARDVNWSASDT